MSYERDSDRRTRGVGAIAASDQVMPANPRRDLELARATTRRDRRIIATGLGSAVLYRRAMSGVAVPETGPPTKPPVTGGLVRDHRTSPPAPSSLPPAAPPSANQAAPLAPGRVPLPTRDNRTPIASSRGERALLVPVVIGPAPVPVPVAPVPVATPPAPTPAPVTAPVRTVIVSGGGGSGGVFVGNKSPGGGLVLTAPPLTPLPSDPVDVGPPVQSGSKTTQYVAIAGGAALAAYFLFFRGNK